MKKWWKDWKKWVAFWILIIITASDGTFFPYPNIIALLTLIFGFVYYKNGGEKEYKFDHLFKE